MLTLLLWRKVSSSVIFSRIPFAFNCISRRQLVGVGVDIGLASFRYRRHTEAAVPATTSLPPKAI